MPCKMITDNAVVGFECLHAIKRKKRNEGLMAIKLDMSKDYDKVEWGFVECMMRKLGFSENWVERVMRCVTSISYSFVISGEVCRKVKPTRGLRQGDPRLPYLFLICDEGLSSLIINSHARGLISGFKCSRFRPSITHLFFENDSMLFSRATTSDCEATKNMLDVYKKASGQIVSISKFALCVSPYVGHGESVRLAGILGIQVVACHERYLGWSCYVGRKKKELFVDIVNRV
ncbi:hypothetical protein Ddye_016355 [Dipteronia dyeriana]|uniref:Reverse transcriptase domain-containing protein n=1 Tax=Dipteronia dyeriana TaxID=168575 RepID=A0AAD9U6L8_9ROSI|nr:hypothetical protein Ddye_016355 [Dipteronia dyeriana]